MRRQEAWNAEKGRVISNMNGLLKFITCGSVDDGKSTLIGQLTTEALSLPIHPDTKNIQETWQ